MYGRPVNAPVETGRTRWATVGRRGSTSPWVGGLAEWQVDRTVYLSVAFTWKIDEAYARAAWWRALGYRVIAGGPALFQQKMRHDLAEVAEIPTRQVVIDGHLRTIGAELADAIAQHNPQATVASRGCPVGCSFCIVPALEGLEFSLLPDFPVRPILCDNNLSALPIDFQQHIVGRYKAEGVPLLDANSGFEPRTFDRDCLERWRPINRGPWRFAYDDQADRPHVERVMAMLRAEPKRRKRVYVLIGNEPVDSCLDRIREVIGWGGEPHVQPEIKLTALERRPWVRFDWTEQKLRDVARWANWSSRAGFSFEAYRRSAHSLRDKVDGRQSALLMPEQGHAGSD